MTGRKNLNSLHLEYSEKRFFLFKDVFDQKHRNKERRDKEQKTLLSIECLASKKNKKKPAQKGTGTSYR